MSASIDLPCRIKLEHVQPGDRITVTEDHRGVRSVRSGTVHRITANPDGSRVLYSEEGGILCVRTPWRIEEEYSTSVTLDRRPPALKPGTVLLDVEYNRGVYPVGMVRRDESVALLDLLGNLLGKKVYLRDLSSFTPVPEDNEDSEDAE